MGYFSDDFKTVGELINFLKTFPADTRIRYSEGGGDISVEVCYDEEEAEYNGLWF